MKICHIELYVGEDVVSGVDREGIVQQRLGLAGRGTTLATASESSQKITLLNVKCGSGRDRGVFRCGFRCAR